jgi:hypothetical protein
MHLYVYGPSCCFCHIYRHYFLSKCMYIINYLFTYDSYGPVHTRFYRGECITWASGGEGALDTQKITKKSKIYPAEKLFTADKFFNGVLPILACLHLKMKNLYLKIFLIYRRCRWHRWYTFIRDYLREFSKKFETIQMGYSVARGTLNSKISCQTPFNECPLGGIIPGSRNNSLVMSKVKCTAFGLCLLGCFL